MTDELRKELTQILRQYDAIGSWWSYEKDKIPSEVKQYIATKNGFELEEFDHFCGDICQDMYSTCKPDISTGDFG